MEIQVWIRSTSTFWRRNLIVWGCCTIEGFVNEEGIAWLGDDFFRGNIERLDITKKVAVLYALKYRKRLSSDHVVLKEVKKLFDLRNGLVHPKAKFRRRNEAARNDPHDRIKETAPADIRKLFHQVTNLFKVEPRDVNKSKSTGRSDPGKKQHPPLTLSLSPEYRGEGTKPTRDELGVEPLRGEFRVAL